MPPEPLPWDRKDVFRKRKHERWRDSSRWGSPDFRRQIGHGKQGNWHFFPEESGHSNGYVSSRSAEKVVEDESCRPISRGEMRYGRNRRDNRGPYNHREWRDHSWDGRNGFSNIPGRAHDINNEHKSRDDMPPYSSHSNGSFGNTWDQIQLRDQHDKMSGSTGQRCDRQNAVVFNDWKPIKWTRSGSLSSRGSGYGHLSSSKSMGVMDSREAIDSETKNGSHLQSPSGDANACNAPTTVLEDATSRKKARLGWGEGLAKYEKKKDVVTTRDEAEFGISPGEPLHSLSSSLIEKSPRMLSLSDCASPATPSSSLACSTVPGMEEKSFEKVENIDNDGSNLCGSSSPIRENRFSFKFEKWDLNSSANLGAALCELLQSDDRNLLDSSCVRATKMNKLLVWKADVSKALEVTELEIDQLETELKLLNSTCGGGSSLSRDNEEDDIQNPLQIPFSESDDAGVGKSSVSEEVCVNPGNVVSQFGGPLCLASEEVGDEEADTSSAVVLYGDTAYDAVMLSNKIIAKEARDVFSKLLPPGECKLDIAAVCNACQNLLVEDKFVQRKRFLKFEERVITLKFKVYQHLWKEDLRLLSVRKHRAKSPKKFELSLRSVHNGSQKHRSSIRSRFSSPAGNLSLVPTAEVMKFSCKLLAESQVRLYRNILKMPALILDKREKVTSRFISNNGLVEDPRALEKGRAVINPWTAAERRVFMDNLALFGKNFKRIASFLDHKTTADCVEFYYKNHKSDCFEKKKKKLDSGGKQAKSLSSGNYLMTLGGKKWNRERNAASLDILGEASVMVANADNNIRSRQACPGNFILSGTKASWTVRNERENAAADVLAGICSSVSSEAVSSIDPKGPEWKIDSAVRQPGTAQNADEDTCSDDSCGDTDSTDWTDSEKSMFIQAVSSYGRDFAKISERVRTRSRDECRVFFSKARKCLGLDRMHPGQHADRDPAGDNASGGGGGFALESASAVSDSKLKLKHHESDPVETVNSQSELSSSEGKDGELVDHKDNIGASEPDVCQAWVRPNVVSDGDSNIVNGVDDQSEVLPVNESESVLVMGGALCDTAGIKPVDDEKGSASCSGQRDSNSGFSHYQHPVSLELNLPHAITIPSPNSGIEDKMSSSAKHLSVSTKAEQDVRCISFSQVPYSESGGSNPFSLQGSYLQKCNSSMPHVLQERRRAYSLSLSDSENSSRSSGDVKLFGKILSNPSSVQKATSNVEENKLQYGNGYENVQMRSFTYWDGKFSPVPDSTILLAKYPAAFGAFPKTESSSGWERSMRVTDPVAALKLHFDQAKAKGT